MFAMALKTFYPRENLLPNEQAMELWFRQLQDIPYDVAEVTLNKWVATNKWSPSIAEIREQASTIKTGEIPDWGQGWDATCRAIRIYGSYKVKEAMESLDDITRQTVQRIGFKNLCMSENVTADRANFRMIYEQIAERKKREEQLPPQFTQLIMQLQQKTQLALEGKAEE